jgi:hypothetical protein
MLMADEHIDHEKRFEVTASEINTIWFTEDTHTLYSPVRIVIEGSYIDSIQFEHLAPISVGALITMLGEPDRAFIELDETTDGGLLVYYALYFSSQRTSLSVYPGSWDGPNPEDDVRTLTLNSDFTYSNFFKKGISQPWLGYGRLSEYLPGQELPSGPYSSPDEEEW